MWRAVARARTSGCSVSEQTMPDTRCCVVMHRGDLLQRVVGPSHEKAAQASNAVGDVGNVIVMVLDFPVNVAC